MIGLLSLGYYLQLSSLYLYCSKFSDGVDCILQHSFQMIICKLDSRFELVVFPYLVLPMKDEGMGTTSTLSIPKVSAGDV